MIATTKELESTEGDRSRVYVFFGHKKMPAVSSGCYRRPRVIVYYHLLDAANVRLFWIVQEKSEFFLRGAGLQAEKSTQANRKLLSS